MGLFYFIVIYFIQFTIFTLLQVEIIMWLNELEVGAPRVLS